MDKDEEDDEDVQLKTVSFEVVQEKIEILQKRFEVGHKNLLLRKYQLRISFYSSSHYRYVFGFTFITSEIRNHKMSWLIL